jgi:3-oxoacyl-[acyl-carrier-protein] synthase-1
MEKEMGRIYNIADNIISALGFSTEENVEAVSSGRSAVAPQGCRFGVAEPWAGSVIGDDAFLAHFGGDDRVMQLPTRFERLCAASILSAAKGLESLLSSERTLFVFSTTKGNVELLSADLSAAEEERLLPLWKSAERVVQAVGGKGIPVVVSNACISGVAAQVVAERMLRSDGRYDTAVVVGADVLSRFIVSGFQSFKAVSDQPCRPFDATRCGLNLGEGAGTIIYQLSEEEKDRPEILGGAVTDDANHISGPSRTGEGLFRAIEQTLTDAENLRFVNVHGTSTVYNDEMEAIALSRASLSDTPTFSLKGYIGHTLGASGTLETIISQHALMEGFIPQSLGYENCGVTRPLHITKQVETFSDGGRALKTVSGFGGCNAALTFGYGCISSTGKRTEIKIRTGGRAEYHFTGDVDHFLSEEYHRMHIDYPKFFKMDRLAKAAFLLAEQLLDVDEDNENTGVFLVNSTASTDTDKVYADTIRDDAYFPSPAHFVYTLPNISIGEICIRQHIFGENLFFVASDEENSPLNSYLLQAFAHNPKMKRALTGWMEVGPDHCFAHAEMHEKI